MITPTIYSNNENIQFAKYKTQPIRDVTKSFLYVYQRFFTTAAISPKYSNSL